TTPSCPMRRRRSRSTPVSRRSPTRTAVRPCRRASGHSSRPRGSTYREGARSTPPCGPAAQGPAFQGGAMSSGRHHPVGAGELTGERIDFLDDPVAAGWTDPPQVVMAGPIDGDQQRVYAAGTGLVDRPGGVAQAVFHAAPVGAVVDVVRVAV